MRFLLDQCLSVDLVHLLAEAGHDVVHLSDRGMQRAQDPAVLDLARAEQRVLVSVDTDFGTLLTRTGASSPSVVLFRRSTGRRPGAQAAIPLDNLAQIADALGEGSVVVLEEGRVRIRRLPVAE